MDVANIYGNKLLLIDDDKNNYCKDNIIGILNNENLDSAIIYEKIEDDNYSKYSKHSNYSKYSKYKIEILEKDYSYSTMCGNGCIAMGLKLKKDLILFNRDNENLQVNVFYKNNKVELQLSIKNVDSNTYSISGELHKVYFIENYTEDEHRKIGLQNIPISNTTVVFCKNERYYYTTFERGVNDITKSCGTGSFAAINFINSINSINRGNSIKNIYTLDDLLYRFEINNDKYTLHYDNGV